MSSQDNDQDNRVVAVVLISTILLAVGLALGMGIYKSRSGSGSGESAAAASAPMAAEGAHGAADAGNNMAEGAVASADASAAADAAGATSGAPADATAPAAGEGAAVASGASALADEASVVMENGVVKFYFASGKSDLASGALAALGDAIAAAKGGKRLVLSGFHDSTGSAAANAELAKKRAMAVRDALMAAGVAESSLELKKPEVSTGSGSAAEARRVEVTIVE